MTTPDSSSPDAKAVTADEGLPTPKPRIVICPYCGCRTEEAAACSQCNGRFDPLSRQATQNSMGPWWVRDERRANAPGCHFAAIVRLIESGSVGLDTVIRGPTSRQFWMLARHTPGVANRLGVCHNCGKEAGDSEFSCAGCGALFTLEPDRQFLGLGPVRELSHTPTIEPVGPPAGATLSRDANGRTTRGNERQHNNPRAQPRVVAPAPHRISQRRLAVNLMVGCAVFVLVVGLALSALNLMPSDLFKSSAAGPSDTVLGESTNVSPAVADSGSEAGGTSDHDSARPGLLAFAEATKAIGEAVPPTVETGEVASEAPAADPQPVVSSEQRVYERSLEVLRLGDPAAVRQSILALDALLTAPRSPDWARPMRDRLQSRLERLQFARLP